MNQPIDIIAARTHPREYLLHKYWSRKPSNIISHLLKRLTPSGGVVLDPFCGSGVSLLESISLGYTAYGFDVNPIAVLISSLMVEPPILDKYTSLVDPIISEFGILCDSAYRLENKSKLIRYNVHEICVICPQCSETIRLAKAKRLGRLYKCHLCSHGLHFNLENLISTSVSSTICENGNRVTVPSELQYQERCSQQSYYITKENYTYKFIPNRRILAFSGMTTSHLFTPRNFSLLSYLADRFHDISDIEVRNAAIVMLTASVAQCSRLIPYRNNMTTGGPAWSVPGFWVPPIHLETNPFTHIKARYRKFLQGLSSLHRRKHKGVAHVKCCDAHDGLRSLNKDDFVADLVFFDPPYGDSVPFLEFSQLWNSFLRIMPSVDLDVSVSDRVTKDVSWKQYCEKLNAILVEIPKVLKPAGRLLITFNNHDPRAWSALIHALQDSKFSCEYVTYQLPAVISSKAQFSVKGSYISDIYSIWKHEPSKNPPQVSMTTIFNALQRCALAREGRIHQSLAYRTFMLTLIKNNLSHKCLDSRDLFLDTLFDKVGGELVWKGPINTSIPNFKQLVIGVAETYLRGANKHWSDLYENIARSVVDADIGLPDPSEVRIVLEGTVLYSKDHCYLIRDTQEDRQLVLFTQQPGEKL